MKVDILTIPSHNSTPHQLCIVQMRKVAVFANLQTHLLYYLLFSRQRDLIHGQPSQFYFHHINKHADGRSNDKLRQFVKHHRSKVLNVKMMLHDRIYLCDIMIKDIILKDDVA